MHIPRGRKNNYLLTGLKFGQLRVLRRDGQTKQGATRWLVVCTCGVKKTVRGSQLVEGGTVSCGCFKNAQASKRTTTHGMTDTFEFRVWTAMRKRCNYEKHPKYANYGGRGIVVCKRWDKFENFYADMGPCRVEKGSIERKNNNKGYSPSNCLWIPKADQSKNRRRK